MVRSRSSAYSQWPCYKEEDETDKGEAPDETPGGDDDGIESGPSGAGDGGRAWRIQLLTSWGAV
jgi:hypothetical protein